MTDTAGDWYIDHQDHVDRLMASTTDKFAPSGSDRFHPELWKAQHWKYYFDEGDLTTPKPGGTLKISSTEPEK